MGAWNVSLDTKMAKWSHHKHPLEDDLEKGRYVFDKFQQRKGSVLVLFS